MENSRKYFYPGTYITIDERMISYRGRAENIVYEISKPKKMGIWAICTYRFKYGIYLLF